MQVNLIPCVFEKKGEPGDFEYEIEHHFRANALYIFNDNAKDHKSGKPGGGNAIIRKYNRYSGAKKVCAAGVSTGLSHSKGGFLHLGRKERAIIDSDLLEVRQLLATGKYSEVVYSADPNDSSLLGTGIFYVSEDVKRYIVSQLAKVVSESDYELPRGIVALIEALIAMIDGLICSKRRSALVEDGSIQPRKKRRLV